MSYDAFATTFSNSRKNLHWPELEYIIADMRENNISSVLDIGCGNGRFLEEAEKIGFSTQKYLGIDNSSGMILEAQKLHPNNHFERVSMGEISGSYSLGESTQFDGIIFLASFHHLKTPEERIQTLQDIKNLLAPNGKIYMTNWNLRDQEKYQKDHQGNGDFDIKIGQYMRYYHGFTCEELAGLFDEAGYTIKENRIFEGGRNILTIGSI